jgi:uncharacterized membrane protein
VDASLRSFGMKASLAAAIASIAYDISQVLQVLGILRDPWAKDTASLGASRCS